VPLNYAGEFRSVAIRVGSFYLQLHLVVVALLSQSLACGLLQTETERERNESQRNFKVPQYIQWVRSGLLARLLSLGPPLEVLVFVSTNSDLLFQSVLFCLLEWNARNLDTLTFPTRIGIGFPTD